MAKQMRVGYYGRDDGRVPVRADRLMYLLPIHSSNVVSISWFTSYGSGSKVPLPLAAGAVAAGSAGYGHTDRPE